MLQGQKMGIEEKHQLKLRRDNILPRFKKVSVSWLLVMGDLRWIWIVLNNPEHQVTDAERKRAITKAEKMVEAWERKENKNREKKS